MFQAGGLVVVLVEVGRKAYLASIVPVIVNAVLNEHQVVVDIVAFVSMGDFPRSRLGEKQRGKILASWVTRKMRTIAQFSIRDFDGENPMSDIPEQRAIGPSSKAGSIIGGGSIRTYQALESDSNFNVRKPSLTTSNVQSTSDSNYDSNATPTTSTSTTVLGDPNIPDTDDMLTPRPNVPDPFVQMDPRDLEARAVGGSLTKASSNPYIDDIAPSPYANDTYNTVPQGSTDPNIPSFDIVPPPPDTPPQPPQHRHQNRSPSPSGYATPTSAQGRDSLPSRQRYSSYGSPAGLRVANADPPSPDDSPVAAPETRTYSFSNRNVNEHQEEWPREALLYDQMSGIGRAHGGEGLAPGDAAGVMRQDSVASQASYGGSIRKRYDGSGYGY